MIPNDRPKRALDAASQVARDEADDALADPRWEALSAGSLDAQGRAALLALAAASPRAERAPELFAPLGAEAEDRFAAAALRALSLPADPAEPQGASDPVASRPDTEAAAPVAHVHNSHPSAQVAPSAGRAAPANEVRPPAEVAPSAGRAAAAGRGRLSRAWGWAAPLALAAALAGLWLARDRGPGPLPDFELTIAAGPADTRRPGDGEPVPESALTLSPGAELRVKLRPASPVQGRVAARVALVNGGEATVLPARVETSDDGAMRIRAAVPSVVPRADAPAVWILIGRPDDLPPEGPLSPDALSPEKAPGIRVFRREAVWGASAGQPPSGPR